MCPSPKYLLPLFNKLIDNYEIQFPCPYGDGRTSIKVYETIKRLIPKIKNNKN